MIRRYGVIDFDSRDIFHFLLNSLNSLNSLFTFTNLSVIVISRFVLTV